MNGTDHHVEVSGHDTLLAVLRDRLHLTGAKLVCGRGECGACTVLLAPRHSGAGGPDSRAAAPEPAYACLTLAAACEESEVTTIEGLGAGDALHPVQRAFIEHDALQCGFCTPGQILAAVALLRRTPDPSEEDVVRWMSGNLCRCGAYPGIVRAVLHAARAREGSDGA